jgi:CelD/BcsL family acetyltransferase involved in cellulose biosynthesis
VRYRGGMTSMGRIAVAPDRAGVAPARLEAVPAAAAVRAVIRPAAGALAGLARAWTQLARRAAEPNPFAEHWFVAASLPTMAAHADVRLIEVRRGDRLIGLLPVTVEQGYARLPVRFVQNWHHDQMFLGAPLVEAGEETAFWTAVLAALDAADWAPGFLHFRGLVEDGPLHRGLDAARGGAIVHRRLRAALASNLDPEAYLARAVRQKKRKEIRRLRNRLADLGEVRSRLLADEAELDGWCDAFFDLEKSGWKGAVGTALACDPAGRDFFRDVVRGAWRAGRLQFRRLDVDGRAIAMLVNFLTAPGGFSFKTVFDEGYARFSPGVLIQIENLDILANPDIAWMDSCAMDDHPMIDSLWLERRRIVRVTVPLAGVRRRAIFALCRLLERGAAAARGRAL